MFNITIRIKLRYTISFMIIIMITITCSLACWCPISKPWSNQDVQYHNHDHLFFGLLISNIKTIIKSRCTISQSWPILWLVDIHAGVVPRELLPRLDALVLSRELRCPVALYFEILTSLILSEIITVLSPCISKYWQV